MSRTFCVRSVLYNYEDDFLVYETFCHLLSLTFKDTAIFFLLYVLFSCEPFSFVMDIF